MVDDAIRLDKWLWHARITKTRTLAQKLVLSGKVRVNRVKALAPGRQIRVGDTLTINHPSGILVYQIAAISQRRGPYSQARLLYNDLGSTMSPAAPTERPQTLKKPDKRDRRAISALRAKNV